MSVFILDVPILNELTCRSSAFCANHCAEAADYKLVLLILWLSLQPNLPSAPRCANGATSLTHTAAKSAGLSVAPLA